MSITRDEQNTSTPTRGEDRREHGSSRQGSSRAVQLRSALRGMSFADQELALAPVQRRGDGHGGADIHGAAAAGVSGASAPLPHLDAIQASFGRHDVGHVQAQVGGAAADASHAIGASAYATGDRVAFAAAPSLHTAAHEAAHVVQQRAGVSLLGGVGRVGDPYERHADAVADRVVQGKSAEGLLDAYAGGGGGGAAVQRIGMDVGMGKHTLTTAVDAGPPDPGAGAGSVGYKYSLESYIVNKPLKGVIGLRMALGASVGGSLSSAETPDGERVNFKVGFFSNIGLGLYGGGAELNVFGEAQAEMEHTLNGSKTGAGWDDFQGTGNIALTMSLVVGVHTGGFDLVRVTLTSTEIGELRGVLFDTSKIIDTGDFVPGKELQSAVDECESVLNWWNGDDDAHTLVRTTAMSSLTTEMKARLLRQLNDSNVPHDHEVSMLILIQGTPASQRYALLKKASGKATWRGITDWLDSGIENGYVIRELGQLLMAAGATKSSDYPWFWTPKNLPAKKDEELEEWKRKHGGGGGIPTAAAAAKALYGGAGAAAGGGGALGGGKGIAGASGNALHDG